MAKVIFVHGVATRPGPALDAARANMKNLLEVAVFKDTAFELISPLWGDLVPVVPPEVYATDEEKEAFSIGGGADHAFAATADADKGGLAGSATVASDAPTIGAVAATHPQLAVDTVLTALVDEADGEGRELSTDELAVFAKAVDAFDEPDRVADLTSASSDDEALGDALERDSDSYSISFSPIRKAIASVTDRIRNVTSGFAYDLVRGSIRPAVGMFSGDVFAYLYDGKLRAEIRERVRTAVNVAWHDRAEGDPLIVVGHSMGGVILIDMLADPEDSDLPNDLVVDCLFTVGSQPSLFQAVGALFGGSPATGSRSKAPACIRKWFNVFDPIDPLAFRADPIFDDVEDLEFNSITGVASAHTTYFKRPQFYARFRARLSDLGLIR